MGKRIALLTSGGDCAGLNAVIRAVVRRAHHAYDFDVIGIRKGTHGLLARPVEIEELKPEHDDAALLRLGGTVLGTTNKGDPFAFPMPDGTLKDRSEEIVEGFRALDLDALIGVGGDGSLKILSRLALPGGIPFVGIPKTIDNDVARTERAVGYTTAVPTATEALDRLQPTAATHDRLMVLELMGRDAGFIALHAGVAGDADVILIPEIPFDLEVVCAKIRDRDAAGRRFSLVAVSEGARPLGGAQTFRALADDITVARLGGIAAQVGEVRSVLAVVRRRYGRGLRGGLHHAGW